MVKDAATGSVQRFYFDADTQTLKPKKKELSPELEDFARNFEAMHADSDKFNKFKAQDMVNYEYGKAYLDVFLSEVNSPTGFKAEDAVKYAERSLSAQYGVDVGAIMSSGEKSHLLASLTNTLNSMGYSKQPLAKEMSKKFSLNDKADKALKKEIREFKKQNQEKKPKKTGKKKEKQQKNAEK